ncbi:MAG: SIR2 family NAD-dependent protein deacylase [Bilifractor sp.]|jgi:NAD-dependent deacetylase
MSIRYLKEILENSNKIVCLLGREVAAQSGGVFYQSDFIYDTEIKYGVSPDEIFSTIYYRNRPNEFFRFYREEVLLKRPKPDGVNFALKRMQDDGRLSAIVTRGFFNVSSSIGCENVIQLYGTVDVNHCPHCGAEYSADYILNHKPIPKCEKCGTMIHPGVTLAGEMLDSGVMTKAAEAVSCADTLLVIGCSLSSRLGELGRYFNGNKIVLVNTTEHYTDRRADCVCIGPSLEKILEEAYPGGHPVRGSRE